MRRIILFLLLFISFSFSDSALLLKKGWQLIGSTSKIENMSLFEAKNVEQVWQYDATAQIWKGYAPDSAIRKKMSDEGYAEISSLESWHGFWIKSKNEWALTFPSDVTKRDENITLKKGWNLISLPVNTVVSPHIFDNCTVWKYAKKNQWELFEKETEEDFPIISHITNSDGIWVKSEEEQVISIATDSAKLRNFETVSEMNAYIKDMLLTNDRPICGYYPMVGGSMIVDMVMEDSAGVENGVAKDTVQTTPQATDASGTNVQEQGVDESDIVKHDNTNIFYVSRNLNNSHEMYVNITTFDNIANNILNPIDKITIKGSVDSLYLVDEKLVVLSRYGYDNYKLIEPTAQEQIAIDHGGDVSSMIVDIFNVSNLSDIKKSATFKINGHLNNSRVIDGKLFLITNYYPYVHKEYPKIYVTVPECQNFFSSSVAETVDSYSDYKTYARCYNLHIDENGKYFRYDYDNPTITYERITPYVQKNSENEKALITPETFFAPYKKDQDPTITTVSKIDILSANLEKTSSILGYSSTAYASGKALYLVSNKYPMFYNFDRYQERSVVYKFSLDNTLAYEAAGFVNGRVLNQFSLSEHEDILRIATTEGNSWQNDTLNSLYTLNQQNDSLLIHGVLSGLGEEGETIRSVRFMENRGYEVTFKQTDPFYTIDLTNANNPIKVGALKIDGYSSYLHPIDEDKILGIGRDATSDGRVTGLKMELFDVSDFNNPISVDTYNFGNLYSYSEMEHNHKALAYRDSDKLFGFAYNLGNRINNLGVFQIEGNNINAYNPLTSPNATQYYNSYERGLIFDDASGQTFVAYFANGKITASELDDLK